MNDWKTWFSDACYGLSGIHRTLQMIKPENRDKKFPIYPLETWHPHIQGHHIVGLINTVVNCDYMAVTTQNKKRLIKQEHGSQEFKCKKIKNPFIDEIYKSTTVGLLI